VTERAQAQVPANGPAHALNSSVFPPVAKTAAEDWDREGVVRAPPSVRASPSAALRRVIPERALELVVPESAPSRAALTGVAVVQIRENHCNQVLPVMHQGRQEGEMVRPNRGLNDDDCVGTGIQEALEEPEEGRRVGRAGR